MRRHTFTTNEGFCVPTANAGATPTPVPLTISGVTAFWDFSTPSRYSLVGSKVSQVTDPVGGNNLTQTTDANRPTIAASGGFNGRGYATFDGASSYMASPSFALWAPNNLSIVARVAAPPQSNGSIVGFTDNTVNPYFYFLSSDPATSKLLCRVSDLTFGASVESAATAFVNTSTWKTLAMTFTITGGTMTFKMYVNSATADTNSQTAGANASVGATAACFVGARENTPLGFLNGRLEYVALYNRALTSTEIGQLIAYGS